MTPNTEANAPAATSAVAIVNALKVYKGPLKASFVDCGGRGIEERTLWFGYGGDAGVDGLARRCTRGGDAAGEPSKGDAGRATVPYLLLGGACPCMSRLEDACRPVLYRRNMIIGTTRATEDTASYGRG